MITLTIILTVILAMFAVALLAFLAGFRLIGDVAIGAGLIGLIIWGFTLIF